MKSQAIAQEALTRAQSGQSVANYAPIYEGFAAKGIPMDAILPRENVLTFHAWLALGRCVRKGEHGVSVTTWIPWSRERTQDDGTKTQEHGKRCKRATVFHISQTEPTKG